MLIDIEVLDMYIGCVEVLDLNTCMWEFLFLWFIVNFQFKILDKEAKEKEKAAQQLAVPRLSVCADAQKVDRAKLAQTEVNLINS